MLKNDEDQHLLEFGGQKLKFLPKGVEYWGFSVPKILSPEPVMSTGEWIRGLSGKEIFRLMNAEDVTAIGDY
jgi:hypothetical protein